MTSTAPIRLLVDPPLSGPENMARDEALLRAAGGPGAAAALRLYRWKEPTVSLGYFQRYAEYAALPPPAGNLPVVRRPTGGGAILHDLELTYALILPADHSMLSEGPNRVYEWMHDAIIMSLRAPAPSLRRCGATDDSSATRGPFFCFARRHCFDVTAGDAKLAGSAQRRTRMGTLQHGSIIVGSRFAQQPTASLGGDPDETIAALIETLPRSLSNLTGEAVVHGEWASTELESLPPLIEKHADPAWLRRM